MEFERFVNEEEGVVVSKLFNVKDVLYNDVIDIWNKNVVSNWGVSLVADRVIDIINEYLNSLPHNNYIIGKAKCNYSAGDKFDIEIGTCIADTRCELKYRKLLNGFYDYIITSIDNLKQDYSNAALSNYNKVEKVVDWYSKKVLGEYNDSEGTV